MRITTRNAVLLLVLLALLAGCSHPMRKKTDDFSETTELFVERLRWHEFSSAATHFDLDLQTDFLDRYEDWEDLKITQVRQVRSVIEEQRKRVTIHYKIEFYILPSMSIKKERVVLTWELQDAPDGKSQSWRVVTEFPTLGEEK